MAVDKTDADICPICKSSRYLNPNLRFLVNPECYHKMCESCVDRLFSQGPASCPVFACGRTLRKQRFRRQRFEDLRIEREVDIRRRVAGVFNRRQDEFETLRAYNDYLENVENLTFNLIYRVDVEETEAKLNAYAAQNRDVIARNSALGHTDTAAEEEQSRSRRQEVLQGQETDRLVKLEADREASEQIARGNANLKKSTARRKGQDKSLDGGRDENGAPPAIFEIQGLKKVPDAAPRAVFDPFGGLAFAPRYYAKSKTFEHPWLDNARKDPAVVTGGYDVGDYAARAMLEAFAGLGVFIGRS